MPVRLVYGLLFALSGYPKLFSEVGHDNIVYLLGQLHFPAPEIMGWVVGSVEFFGGLALIVGFLTRLVAGFNVLSISTLLLLAYLGDGIPKPQDPALWHFPYELPGYQVSFYIIAGLIFLFLGGAGALSIDRWWANRQSA